MVEAIKIIAVIVGLVIYYAVFKRITRPPQPTKPKRPVGPPLAEGRPPVVKRKKTFEELLQEFDQMVASNLPKPTVEDLRPLRQQREKLTDVPQMPEEMKPEDLTGDAPPPRSLERFLATAISLEGQSLETVGPLYRYPPLVAPQPLSEPTAPQAHPMAQFIQQPDQLRNAFILSEILKRKW
jgi:hypothetical protein